MNNPINDLLGQISSDASNCFNWAKRISYSRSRNWMTGGENRRCIPPHYEVLETLDTKHFRALRCIGYKTGKIVPGWILNKRNPNWASSYSYAYLCSLASIIHTGFVKVVQGGLKTCLPARENALWEFTVQTVLVIHARRYAYRTDLTAAVESYCITLKFKRS